jgi:hypothetical protein
MDVRVYFQKVRQTEASIGEPQPVVVSLDTPDGGREGVRTEVTRALAARMIVDGWARLATAEEAAEYRQKTVEAKQAAEQAAAVGRLQIAVISDSDLRAFKSGKESGKQR